MPKYPINVFLPAAGLGERLRPVTKHLPKPLLPVLGRPLIGIILGKLISICEGRIGVNLHYHQDLILHWFKDSPHEKHVVFFPENPILGTGGALKNAESFLAGGPFLVHNADILLDIPFGRLIEAHLASGNIATLAVHRHPLLSNVVIDDNDFVIDVENAGDSRPDPTRIARKVAFTGVAMYAPEILKFLPSGVSHATTAWLAASRAGHKVKIMDFTGSYWSDVGNPATYAAAVLDTLRMIGETVHRSSAARIGRADLEGYVVIEKGSMVRDGSRLRNCIVMPGSDVSGSHENCILGPDYRVQLSEAEMQPSFHAALRKDVGLTGPLYQFFDAPAADKGSIGAATLVGLGGSDRRYFRVRKGSRSAVLMECRKDDPDFDRHIACTRFFHAQGIPVPQLLGTDEKGRRALFEDLGDLSLYTALKLSSAPDRVEALYRLALDVLVRLHGRATERVHDCPPLSSRIFDYDHLRWETSYFLEQFVIRLREAVLVSRTELDDDLHRLARAVGTFLPSVIHRDFQCQNIMVQKGAVRVIDYQGARMAPPAYDVASLLWDPYYRLDDDQRDRLLAYYIGQMKSQARDFEEGPFRDSLLPCRLQRHMQALGAYAFLSLEKGKRYFLKYIPEAVWQLKQETELAQQDYPVLFDLMQHLS